MNPGMLLLTFGDIFTARGGLARIQTGALPAMASPAQEAAITAAAARAGIDPGDGRDRFTDEGAVLPWPPTRASITKWRRYLARAGRK